MCMHLMIGAVSRCCNRNRPGHENDDRWTLRIYWYSALVMALLILGLIVLSFFLEWGRERNWRISSGMSRQQTSVPLVIACGLTLIAILELVCLYPSIKTLIRNTRAMNGLDEDLYPDDDPDQELAGQTVISRGDNSSNNSFPPRFVIGGDDDDDDPELSHPPATEGPITTATSPAGTALHRVRRAPGQDQSLPPAAPTGSPRLGVELEPESSGASGK